MKKALRTLVAIHVLAVVLAAPLLHAAETGNEKEPVVMDPGPPPSDAVVLFDGKDLAQWNAQSGGEPKWKLPGDGTMEVNGTGSLMTREEFGDCQLHIEWATPVVVKGDGQGRGNSGVYLQGRYEIQVLDSYQNKTCFNG